MTAKDQAMSLIRDRIAISGITPAVLAKRCGLGNDTIYRWLSGAREPKLADLEKVMSHLGFEITFRPSF